VSPTARSFRVAGIPLPWLALGVAVYPVLVAGGWLYTRLAERNERDFLDVVDRYRSVVWIDTNDLIEVAVDGSWYWMQAYSGDTLPPGVGRRRVCVEPMSCPPSAFADGPELVVRDRRQDWSGTWTLTIAVTKAGVELDLQALSDSEEGFSLTFPKGREKWACYGCHLSDDDISNTPEAGDTDPRHHAAIRSAGEVQLGGSVCHHVCRHAGLVPRRRLLVSVLARRRHGFPDRLQRLAAQ